MQAGDVWVCFLVCCAPCVGGEFFRPYDGGLLCVVVFFVVLFWGCAGVLLRVVAVVVLDEWGSDTQLICNGVIAIVLG